MMPTENGDGAGLPGLEPAAGTLRRGVRGDDGGRRVQHLPADDRDHRHACGAERRHADAEYIERGLAGEQR
jgi:hypothetical protein